MYTAFFIGTLVWLGGVVVAHLEWEPGDRGSNPRSRHYSTG